MAVGDRSKAQRIVVINKGWDPSVISGAKGEPDFDMDKWDSVPNPGNSKGYVGKFAAASNPGEGDRAFKGTYSGPIPDNHQGMMPNSTPGEVGQGIPFSHPDEPRGYLSRGTKNADPTPGGGWE